MPQKRMMIVILVVALTSAIKVQAMDQEALKQQVSAVVESGNRFAFDLYQRQRADRGNLIFSPASISMALAMTYAGAAGSTASEMAKVLHFQMPEPKLHDEMRALQVSWKTFDEKQRIRLDVANRLWGQEGSKFLPEFLQVTRTDYAAELGQVDFLKNYEQARQTINSWVEDHTEKKIVDLISSAKMLDNARLVLTNAVYFKGAWSEPFELRQTKDEDFHPSSARKIKAPLMRNTAHFSYAAVEGLQLLQLPYGDRSLSMVVLLPEKIDGLNELEGNLTSANCQKWIASLGSRRVSVVLPRFKTTAQLQLKETLKAMGMVSAFDSQTADFSRMTVDEKLFVSAVVHKAFVDVNEFGTEAAAATGVVMHPTAVFGGSPPPVFRADHPFVFLIRDNRTEAILFLGRVVDPTK